MQVALENAEGLKRSLMVTVAHTQVDSAVQQRLKKLAQTVRLSGFRPGKVPFQVIHKRYGAQIRKEVLDEMVESSFYEAIRKENLKPAGYPQIEAVSVEPGKDVQFWAHFEVLPVVQLSDSKQLNLERIVAKISEIEVDQKLEEVRKSQRSIHPVDRPSQEGDELMIDFEGKIDNKAFSGGKAENFSLVLGAKAMGADFEQSLYRLMPGEEKDIVVLFPADYAGKEVAAKEVEFHIRVHSVNEQHLPELDDAFATRMGIEGGLSALREQVRVNLDQELRHYLKDKQRKITMDTLYAVNPLDIPQVLVVQEAQRLFQEGQTELKRLGYDPQLLVVDKFTEQAKKRVALGFIFAELIREQNLTPAPERVREFIETIANSTERPEEIIRWYYGNKDRMKEIESVVLEEQAVDWVLSQAQVTEKEVTLKELREKKVD